LPKTAQTTAENIENGIRITWKAVSGAKGYVIYRRAWNLTSAGWTSFERWNNTTETTWTDTKVYAGTRYQYGIKAYPVDPMDNYNLGIVGPLKTTVRITTRTLTSVSAGEKKLTAKWSASKVFTGYELQVATDSAFTKNLKTITIADPNTSRKTVTGLKSDRRYYVRVRSYHIFEGTTYYGQWSETRNCKVK
jgi:Fibronectin type III domain.